MGEFGKFAFLALPIKQGDDFKQWLSRISHPVIESIYGDTRGAKDFVDQVDKVTEKVKQTGDRDPLAALEQKQKEELAALAKFVQDNYLKKNEQT